MDPHQEMMANAAQSFAKQGIASSDQSVAVQQPPITDPVQSLLSSQTSKQDSSQSILAPGTVSGPAAPTNTSSHLISIAAEPVAANLKSASSVTRQMNDTTEMPSGCGTGNSAAHSSLKVTQQAMSACDAPISSFYGDLTGGQSGDQKQKQPQQTSKDGEVLNGSNTNGGLPQQQQPVAPLKLASAQSIIHNHLTSQVVYPQPSATAADQPAQTIPTYDDAVPQNALSMGPASSANAESHGTNDHANNAPNGTAMLRPDAFMPMSKFSSSVSVANNQDEDRNTLISQLLQSAEPDFDIYADLPKATPNTDPDNCFKCKNPGDFINCSSCEKPYHLFCADLERMPDRVWECFECQHISRERLIRNLKEKQRQKVREREIKKERDRIEREQTKKHREDEQKIRREVKEQRKYAYKIAKLEQQEHRRLVQAEQVAQVAALRAQQMVMGPDGKPVLASTLRQTTLKTEKRKKVKTEHLLTPAEREKIERNRLIKQQFQVFAEMYPQYVERNSVRYPIPDALIPRMPELHGGVFQPKPTPMKIRMEADSFERLLYIWEFSNNFSEFLETPNFKLEELAACLSYSTESDPRFQLNMDEDEDLDWNEKMQMRHINEKGFHILNHLHTALAQCYLRHLFPNNDQLPNALSTQAAIAAGIENQNQILASIDKLIEDKQKLWPEIIRLIFTYAKSEDVGVFGPLDEEMETIRQKLVGIKPAQFSASFTEHEKVTLLTVLIDMIHETNDFRLFLNRRVEDKSTYNKEKMEVYQQIRDLEARLQDFIKQQAEDESTMTQEQMQEQMNRLMEQLNAATRIEAKPLKEQIYALERKNNYYQNQLSKFEDQIKRKQLQITRLTDKTTKTSIKTTMLGKDSEKSEYWHFKDDNTRVYIRMEKEVPLFIENVEMADEEGDQQRQAQSSLELQLGQKDSTQLDSNNDQIPQMFNPTDEDRIQQLRVQLADVKPKVPTEIHYSWFYYERDDQIDQLLECMNFRGQRERKLQENLRKVRDRLKLKKAKKMAQSKVFAEESMTNAATDKPITEQTGEEGVSTSQPEGAASPEVQEGAEVAPKQNAVVEMTNEGEQKSVVTNTEKADQTNNATVEEDQEDEEEDLVRRVMFQTDNWTDCITEAVFFGQKIPPKRRAGGRMAAYQKCAVSEFFEDIITLEACKEYLLSISDSYMRASSDHDREWEDEKVREVWAEQVNAAQTIIEMIPLISQLDTGMSLPTSLCVRAGQNGEPDKIQRMKLQLFKFWPSQDIKQAWKQYMEQAGSLNNDNMNSLYITLKILQTACEQFAIRQAEKMERKNKQAIMQAVQQQQPNGPRVPAPKVNTVQNAANSAASDWTGRMKRASNRRVQKYYESSESESSEDEDEEDEEEEEQRGPEEGTRENEPMEEDKQEESEDEESSEDEQKKPTRSHAGKAIVNGKTNAKKAVVADEPQKRKGVQPSRRRGRRVTQDESEEQEKEDASQEQASQPENKQETDEDNESMEEEIEWEEYCYDCQDGGNVMCCESCPQVAHYQCAGLRVAPKGEWWCKDCTAKKAQQQQRKQSSQASRGAGGATAMSTSTKTASLNGKRGAARQSTLTSMMPKRSSRRAGK